MDFKIIPSRLLQKLDIRVLESDGSLSDEVLSVFSFGEEETERLNQLLVAAGDRLRELEMQEVAFTQLSDDQFHIRIPPIAADVSEGLKEELRQGVKRELGDVDGSAPLGLDEWIA